MKVVDGCGYEAFLNYSTHSTTSAWSPLRSIKHTTHYAMSTKYYIGATMSNVSSNDSDWRVLMKHACHSAIQRQRHHHPTYTSGINVYV